MIQDARPSAVVRGLYDLAAGETVRVRTEETTVVGRLSRIERDQAGVRVEVCPYDGDAPQYRVWAARTPTGWQSPRLERRPLGGEWVACGRLDAVVPLATTPL
ncbi:hypothetical protein [Halosegnis sp.]|uniref:hypothetical protein n=1 Tax=Halosegnis sp. TaxID=2864959 RepID=UPI0035D4EB27